MTKLSVVVWSLSVWFLAHMNTPYHSWVAVSGGVPGGSPVTYCESSVLYWLSTRETSSW